MRVQEESCPSPALTKACTVSDCDSEWVTRYYGSFLKGWKLWIGASLSGFGGEDKADADFSLQSWSTLREDPALTSYATSLSNDLRVD